MNSFQPPNLFYLHKYSFYPVNPATSRVLVQYWMLAKAIVCDEQLFCFFLSLI